MAYWILPMRLCWPKHSRGLAKFLTLSASKAIAPSLSNARHPALISSLIGKNLFGAILPEDWGITVISLALKELSLHRTN
jgi:hypothetical protein